MAVVCYIIMGVCGVMRKTQTTLTYKTLKKRELFLMLKKIFWGQKNPVRLLYVRGFGTTISPWDEVSYIVSCLGETLNIVKSHYKKKFSQGKKMEYKLIARDRVFCEGTLSECQKTLTGISQMISAGLSTDFQVEEFLIVTVIGSEDN